MYAMWAGTVAEGRLGVNVRLVFALHFRFEIFRRPAYSAVVTVETFEAEINDALRAYDKHIVCIDKPTVDCRETLRSLIEKAIIAYETRGPAERRERRRPSDCRDQGHFLVLLRRG